MKILMITPNPFFVDRGFSVQVYEQARALKGLGHEVVFSTYHCGRDIEGFKFFRTPTIPWYDENEVGASYHRFYIDILLFLKAYQTCLKIKPDVLHGHIHEGALIGWIISKLTGIPLLFDLQGGLTGELKERGFFQEGGLSYKVFHKIEGFIDRSAHMVVTQSQAMADELRDTFRVPSDRIFLTMDGVNIEDFSPRPKNNELLDKHKIPADKKLVVYLGLLTTYQGIDCLIEGIPWVLRKANDVHFLIMGYPIEEKYRKMAKDKGIDKNITFTGRIDYRLASDYLALGDIAVSPKLGATEANGKLYNYMAMELPVVAFDTIVNREILGEYGNYAKPYDPQSLGDAIIFLLNHPEEARRLGKELRRRVAQNFTWLQVAQRLEAQYKKVLERNGTGRLPIK